jgi:hypothetical protein
MQTPTRPGRRIDSLPACNGRFARAEEAGREMARIAGAWHWEWLPISRFLMLRL